MGGTGAVSIITDLLARFFPYEKTIYATQPTWGNHPAIFQWVVTPVFVQSGMHSCWQFIILSSCSYRKSGLKVESYRHYDPETVGFNAQGCFEDLKVFGVCQCWYFLCYWAFYSSLPPYSSLPLSLSLFLRGFLINPLFCFILVATIHQGLTQLWENLSIHALNSDCILFTCFADRRMVKAVAHMQGVC